MEDGVCRVQWQPSANLGRDAKWHGQDGGIGSPGFVVLSSIPIGPLKLVTYKGSIQVHKLYGKFKVSHDCFSSV